MFYVLNCVFNTKEEAFSLAAKTGCEAIPVFEEVVFDTFEMYNKIEVYSYGVPTGKTQGAFCYV